METFWQDIRFGARMLLKNKGCTARRAEKLNPVTALAQN